MKSKVIKLLVKRGMDEKSAIKLVEKELEAAMKCYQEAKASKLAEIVTY